MVDTDDVVPSAEEAMADIADGSSIAAGGTVGAVGRRQPPVNEGVCNEFDGP
jgi:hypothetical protein